MYNHLPLVCLQGGKAKALAKIRSEPCSLDSGPKPGWRWWNPLWGEVLGLRVAALHNRVFAAVVCSRIFAAVVYARVLMPLR